MTRIIQRTLKGTDIFDALKKENHQLTAQLTGERARIRRAISMLVQRSPAMSDDEEDDELLNAIVTLFEDYDIC
jgi:hypothetical protein